MRKNAVEWIIEQELKKQKNNKRNEFYNMVEDIKAYKAKPAPSSMTSALQATKPSHVFDENNKKPELLFAKNVKNPQYEIESEDDNEDKVDSPDNSVLAKSNAPTASPSSQAIGPLNRQEFKQYKKQNYGLQEQDISPDDDNIDRSQNSPLQNKPLAQNTVPKPKRRLFDMFMNDPEASQVKYSDRNNNNSTPPSNRNFIDTMNSSTGNAVQDDSPTRKKAGILDTIMQIGVPALLGTLGGVGPLPGLFAGYHKQKSDIESQYRNDTNAYLGKKGLLSKDNYNDDMMDFRQQQLELDKERFMSDKDYRTQMLALKDKRLALGGAGAKEPKYEVYINKIRGRFLGKDPTLTDEEINELEAYEKGQIAKRGFGMN